MTRFRSRLRSALGALLLLAAWPVAPASAGGLPQPKPASCVDGAVAAVQKRYEGMRDLSARFEQTTRSVAFGEAGSETASRGTVVFAKPGKMRWSYEEPEPSLVVSDGHWLWIYDPAHAEVQKMPMGDGFLSGAAVQFLLGEGDLRETFRVTADECGPDRARLTLVPRSPASYELLRLVVDPRSGELRETEIQDLLGNVTSVKLEDVETNRDPEASSFVFEAPDGVEVIELQPAPDPS
jgi:outer membrane lipoprotein carrier protein